MKIVLASGSPRRRELLSLITENFAVCPADAEMIGTPARLRLSEYSSESASPLPALPGAA